MGSLSSCEDCLLQAGGLAQPFVSNSGISPRPGAAYRFAGGCLFGRAVATERSLIRGQNPCFENPAFLARGCRGRSWVVASALVVVASTSLLLAPGGWAARPSTEAGLRSATAVSGRVVLSPRPGQRVRVYPFRVRVRARDHRLHLRVRLNGRGIGSDFGAAVMEKGPSSRHAPCQGSGRSLGFNSRSPECPGAHAQPAPRG